MLLSLNWLKDYVDIPRSVTPEELGLRLTMHTVEIDSVEDQAEQYKDIVVGEILEVKKHPNADKLRLARVRTKNEILDIVCGASNIEAGQKVPVALVGAVMSSGLEIKESNIRGEKSCGMLCAEDELGLGEDHTGILILDNTAKLGQKLSDYLKLKDVIFEVDNKSITHRPDLWGHYGIAREISAFLGCKMKKYNANLRINANQRIANDVNIKIDVRVEDFELCPRYMAVVIDGIKIDESPQWMRDRLIAVGVRPINNIVDITNYVMLELGQPLHAFDSALLARTRIAAKKPTPPFGHPSREGINIGVRTAKKGEVIKTLDGEKRELDEEMLLITDGEDPVAVAGVMGGENSEISDETTGIVFEAANFDFKSIRKTSTKLGLRTESSMRFEKGLDPNLCETALARAVELTQEICAGAKVISRIADSKKFELDQGPIELDLDWLNDYIGEDIGKKKIKEILTSLGFEISEKQAGSFSVLIPTWRATKDVSAREDLAEEVSRIYGYDNLVPVMPKVSMMAPKKNGERALIRRVKEILSVGASITETYNYSFTGEDQLKKLGVDYSDYIKLANPISGDMTLLRQSLVPGIIQNIKTNQARKNYFRLFEIGSVYFNLDGDLSKDIEETEKLPYQEKKLGIAIACGEKDVFKEVKGVIEYLFGILNIGFTFNLTEAIPGWADPIRAAQIVTAGNKILGQVCLINSRSKKKMGIKKEAAIAEVSLKEIYRIITETGEKKFAQIAKYPPVLRDLAFVVAEKVLYNDIREEILGFNEYIKEVELFDVYRGENIGRSRKSLAFHIIYKADKTLTSEEADVIQAKLIKKLEAKFEAKVRDF